MTFLLCLLAYVLWLIVGARAFVARNVKEPDSIARAFWMLNVWPVYL